MRASAGFAYRYFAASTLGCALLAACGGGPASGVVGSGGSGGGGRSASGGSAWAGSGGTSAGGGGIGGIAGGAGATASTGGAMGGASAGTGSGGAGESGRGGSAGAAAGGSAGASFGGRGSGATGGALGGKGGGSGGGGGSTASAGCGTSGAPASGRYSIDVAGTAREYIIKVPAAYDASHPYRLIFAFHGAMYSADTVATGGPPGSGPYYGIESLSGETAIFVAPQALPTSWTDMNGRDVAYVNAMLTRFKSQLCIDQSRVFATGFSMGAIMTIGIGCAGGDVFRAIAPMSGSVRGTCGGDHPIAYWGSHGTNDTTIPIASGEAVRDVFRSRNHCAAQIVPGDRAGCVNYQGCDLGYPVIWCTFSGVHEPPLYAGEAIWSFLAQF